MGDAQMMDREKYKNLMKARISYSKYAAKNHDGSLRSDHKGLYLERGDMISLSGLTIREVELADLPPLGREECIQILIEFWSPKWDQQDRENEMRKSKEAEQRENDERLKRWKKYGPPPLYADRECDDFDVGTPEEEAAFDAVIGFCCTNHSMLAILGTPGTRKTQLAALLLRQEMLEYGKDGQFMTAPDLVRNAKSVELIKRYTSVEILVIDDIGSDSNDVEIVLRIVDARLNNKLSTAYTSNATPTQLEEIYGPRGFSRLMCNAEIVILDGRDWRIRSDPPSQI
jgi:DNA replication protein DnaC